MKVGNKMVLKYFKILYIELFYSFFSIVFLCKLDNLNSELLGKNDLSILTYNNYQSLYFFIGAFILIIFGFYIFIYRFKYILDMEINSFGELFFFIIIEILIIFIIIFIIKFISIPILKTIFKATIVILGISQFLSTK
ncbi:hypothetical protein YWH7054_00260 [Fusobacterium nucleatum YWH7054]|uniref:Uncharacterized protein n=1 Tax=Fusobacterium nucleatum TaxID=851 RepID=A0A133P642_FUSNU|nr:hypothetical protein HMPREF3221_00626 [Fusobacterium nucleatum]MCL4576510.1 hypothetical protein [Fusobacterium nucleatum YWH7056]MCL4582095.1 hypothetical protein [Fusobacterium nucleatum YWH7054]MCL4592355.1 hypothetical protein [Fusobacterium nucleatum YWH7053]